MTWFPEGIPETTNVTKELDYIAYLDQMLSPENGLQLNTDDLTFIIPLGLDSYTRLNNVGLTLLWILRNTTAKVKIHWAQDEQFLKTCEREGTFRFPLLNGEKFDVTADLKKFSGKDIDIMNSSEAHEITRGLMSAFFLERVFNNENWNPCSGSLEMTAALSMVNPNRHPNDTLECISAYLDNAKSRVSIYYEDKDIEAPFHRTRYLNQLLDKVTTKFVCNHDADIIYPFSMTARALGSLRKGLSDFCIPFGHFSETSGLVKVFVDDIGGATAHPHNTARSAFNACLTGDFSDLHTRGIIAGFGAGYGGSVYANTESYKSCGGEIEDLVSWGAEDVERYTRFMKMGYAVSRVSEGRMYHLEHPRYKDSGKQNPFFKRNEQVWSSIQKIHPEKLPELMRLSVKTYGWEIKPGPHYQQLLARFRR